MKEPAGRNIYLIIAIPILLVLLLCELVLFKENNPKEESERIAKIFEQKEMQLDALVDKVVFQINANPKILNDWSLLQLFNQRSEEIAVTVSNERTMLFWSSSLVIFPPDENSFTSSNGLIHLPSGWYYQISKKCEKLTIRGFWLIKREFPYHNRFIKSSFDKELKLPDDYLVKSSPQPEAYNIYKTDGNYLFSILPTLDGIRSYSNSNLSALLYFVLILMLLAQLNVWLIRTRRFGIGIKLLLTLSIPVFMYLIFCGLEFPVTLYNTNLFSPRDFAFSGWLASLGEFILLSILMFHGAQAFFMLNNFEKERKRKQLRKIFSFLFAGFFFSFSAALLKILLLNSSISLEFFSDLKFSAINLYAFFGISLHILGFVIIVLRLRSDYYKELGFLKFVLALFTAGIISGITVSVLFYDLDWMPFIYYGLVILMIARFEVSKIREYKFTFLLIMSIVGASYVNLYAQNLIIGKKNKVLDLIDVKLSTERDPGAEIFLSELDNKLKQDTIIKYHLLPPYKSLESYFRNNYFTGFWRNYNMQITVCAPDDSVFITDENKQYPCLAFFNNLRQTKGMLVSGSSFYFMDRVNGRISYLGQLDFVNAINVPVKLFIELNSKVIPEGKGYPELLLDELASRESQDGDFSYAKYFEGKLVDRGGDYDYSMQLPDNVSAKEEHTRFSKNGYQHCAYNRNGNSYVIASYREIPFYERISTFPYLFLLFYLVGAIVLIFNEKNFRIRNKKLDFREKIQLTLLLSLFGILTIIGIGLMVYNSNKLLTSLQDNLNEKLKSVSSELSLKIDQENDLNPPMRDYLNEQLIVLSDIIRADINLYDLNGRLFATSRSEIYDRGLLSRRINPMAFKAIAVEQRTLFLHNENLGEMNFFSAYSPLYNQNNLLVGYLNLPYFTGQDDFKKQVSDFIVAFSNLYILLIMFSLIVALLISQKLTAPLLQIEKYLKGIQLGKTNAKIEYSGEDEIGRLALEYNKKIDELAESAELLARSERESAWQEMARQVAHEINNPLTPMKLSIQYLQRIKEKEAENFDDYFNRVSRTLVEQIDALSLIASSFSDFARMPGIRNELIYLENMVNVDISFIHSDEEPVRIMADKDQFGRAIINLINNGIQAIPKDKKGVVTVKLSRDEKWAYVSVTDNGAGIPSELQDKLFDPSFTTKSSGMGLGLAITKRIVESFNGEIWFESLPESGTTFFIKLPLMG
jgi:two-component system nitrogen regulation sensor histidine kinase NtrY